MKEKILVIHSSFLEMLEPQVGELRARGYEVVADPQFKYRTVDDVLMEHLPGTSALLSSGSRLTERHLAAADKLKVVSVMASGYEQLDLPLLTAAGIRVTNVPIAEGALPVAELAFGMMYALAREIPKYDSIVKSGRVVKGFGRLVTGKTLGIVGLGAIGKQLVKLARGVSMDVLVYSRTRDERFADEWGVRYAELSDVLRHADYVSLHLRLNERTRHFIGAAELALMKPTAYLVNTARMDLVDKQAAFEALANGKIAGAAFDFGEAQAHLDLFRLDNVICTPHLGNRVAETYRAVVQCGIDNALDVLNGVRPRYIVNPEVYGSTYTALPGRGDLA